jgi:hypothetical protein
MSSLPVTDATLRDRRTPTRLASASASSNTFLVAPTASQLSFDVNRRSQVRIIKQLISGLLASRGYAITRLAAAQTEGATTTTAETEQDREYEFLSRLPGFLDRDAYDLFCKLGLCSLPSPAILEIGIFCGRSFVALGLAFKGAASLTGVDPFYESFTDSPALENEGEYLEAASGHLSRLERIRLVEDAIQGTAEFDPHLPEKFVVRQDSQEDYFGWLKRNGQPRTRFGVVHVDGAHTFQAVYDFLTDAERLLDDGAIVIIDDFLNPGFPGISEAVHTHSVYKTQLFPVLFAFNKAIFIYRPRQASDVTRLSDTLSGAYGHANRPVRQLADGSATVD